ncbi:MAG: response regulator transcription factor [Thiobacillus sp.]|nr:response regulator transcription factor [Thiobacillus sp.]
MPESFQRGFILEDLPELQAWLARTLTEAFPGIVLETAYCLQEARQKLVAQPSSDFTPDIALIDLGLPDGSGVSFIEELKKARPETLCVVASIYDDDVHVFPALRAGASGYLLKDQPIQVIVQALQGIAGGSPPLSPAIARRMLTFFQPVESEQPTLTERELEVLRFISKGLTQRECANLLGLSAHTVVGYVKDIYRKLNVCSRAEAALVARDLGLV